MKPIRRLGREFIINSLTTQAVTKNKYRTINAVTRLFKLKEITPKEKVASKKVEPGTVAAICRITR